LWERFVLPRLGWYPWQCSSCRRVFFVKERGKSKRKKFAPGQTYTSWQPGQPVDRISDHEDDHPHDDLSGE